MSKFIIIPYNILFLFKLIYFGIWRVATIWTRREGGHVRTFDIINPSPQAHTHKIVRGRQYYSSTHTTQAAQGDDGTPWCGPPPPNRAQARSKSPAAAAAPAGWVALPLHPALLRRSDPLPRFSPLSTTPHPTLTANGSGGSDPSRYYSYARASGPQRRAEKRTNPDSDLICRWPHHARRHWSGPTTPRRCGAHMPDVLSPSLSPSPPVLGQPAMFICRGDKCDFPFYFFYF